uniref:Tyrosine-protein kinase ephrin type A/B receptor-like domain-containing protein n=1 Tax=Hanusia phi TaxID=3032 RepID=A0A7S0NEL9_9CRYP
MSGSSNPILLLASILVLAPTLFASSCPPGSFLPLHGVCTPCPTGTFSDSWDTRVWCSRCPVGYINLAPNSTSCPHCDVGFFRDAAASSCKPCGPGEYNMLLDGDRCEQCGSGTVVNGWMCS